MSILQALLASAPKQVWVAPPPQGKPSGDGSKASPVDLTTANLPPYPLALTYRDGRTVAAWTERTEDGALTVRLARNY